MSYNASSSVWTVPGWTTLYSTESEADQSLAGEEFPAPVYSHSLVMLGANFYIRGGNNGGETDSGYIADAWSFNILTKTWSKMRWQGLLRGVAEHAAVAVTIADVLYLAYLGGKGMVAQGLDEFNEDQTPSPGILVDLRPTAVKTFFNDLQLGYGLDFSFSGMYAGMRGSGDSLLVFGGEVNGIPSSQLYSVSVSNVQILDLVRVGVVGAVPEVCPNILYI